MIIQIRDEDIEAALREMLNEEPRNFIDIIERESEKFYQAIVAWIDCGARFVGERGSEPYMEEMASFVTLLEFALATFYYARRGRLPTVAEDLIDQVMKG